MKQVKYKILINSYIKFAKIIGAKRIKIRPIVKVGSGKHSNYSTDHTGKYCAYLDSLRIRYTIGNDSQMGELLGKFILIKIDKRNNFVKNLWLRLSRRTYENEK